MVCIRSETSLCGGVAQLVRVPDCRSGCCGFESRRSRHFFLIPVQWGRIGVRLDHAKGQHYEQHPEQRRIVSSASSCPTSGRMTMQSIHLGRVPAFVSRPPNAPPSSARTANVVNLIPPNPVFCKYSLHCATQHDRMEVGKRRMFNTIELLVFAGCRREESINCKLCHAASRYRMRVYPTPLCGTSWNDG